MVDRAKLRFLKNMKHFFYFFILSILSHSVDAARLCKDVFYSELSGVYFSPNFLDPKHVDEQLRHVLQSRYREYLVSFEGTLVDRLGHRELEFLSSAGVHNYGVYRVKNSKPAKLIKFFKASKINMIPVLKGNLLASSVGGAVVFSFGRAYSKVIGSPFYEGLWFIELEELFPQQKVAIRKRSLMEIKSGEIEYRSLYYIARQILEVFRKNIMINDPDFMINPKGEIRWFDADHWEHLFDPSMRQVERIFLAFSLDKRQEYVLLSIVEDQIKLGNSDLSPMQKIIYSRLVSEYREEYHKKTKLP
jgi:hypothetical protein